MIILLWLEGTVVVALYRCEALTVAAVVVRCAAQQA